MLRRTLVLSLTVWLLVAGCREHRASPGTTDPVVLAAASEIGWTRREPAARQT